MSGLTGAQCAQCAQCTSASILHQQPTFVKTIWSVSPSPVQPGTVTRCCVIRCYHSDLSLRHTPCALKFAMQCAKHKLPKTTLFFIFCFYLRLKPIDCLNAHPVSLHEMPLQTTERSVVQTVSSECNDNANVLCSDQCWNNESYNLLLDQAQAATCARCTPSCGYLRTQAEARLQPCTWDSLVISNTSHQTWLVGICLQSPSPGPSAV